MNLLSESTALDKTKIVTKAINNYIKSLESPPPPLRRAAHEEIMTREKEQVDGYICARGAPVLVAVGLAQPAPLLRE